MKLSESIARLRAASELRNRAAKPRRNRRQMGMVSARLNRRIERMEAGAALLERSATKR